MDKLNNTIINNNLEKYGFAIVKEMLSKDTCLILKDKINKYLREFIKLHKTSEKNYFSVVNRWPLKSLLPDLEVNELLLKLAPKVIEISQIELAPFEIDVLYKSPFAALSTPCHQDIAYAFKRPYLVSTWLALTEVEEAASPLQFLPESHHDPIEPAIDFWQPDFVDRMRQTSLWQQNAVTISAAIGDAVIFSSRIWHGSLTHQTDYPRLALVVRWGNDNIVYEDIPLPKKTDFGMWNCGAYTTTLLKEGLNKIYNLQLEDLFEVIQVWQMQVIQNKLPFGYNKQKAFQALEKLSILNAAYQIYQGGDGQGIIYQNLWRSFLLPLKNYLSK